MSSIFSKNCILSGLIDYYCLICSKHFKNDEDTIAHIGDPVHRESLKSCGYIDKLKEDFIKKIKGSYFCELCGLTFPTITYVRLHIADEKHIISKKGGSTHILRKNNDIVAYDHVLISDEAWNGLVNGTCVLCNVEFDEDTAHKSTQKHILNLMNGQVIFEPVQCLYRKIDDSFYQCLTCNIMANGNDHFESAEHKSAYKNYNVQTGVTNDCKDYTPEIADTNDSKTSKNKTVYKRALNDKDMNKQNEKIKSKQRSPSCKKNTTKDCDDVSNSFIAGKYGDRNTKNSKNDDTSNENKSKLLESLDKYQKSNININFINETAVCKKCSTNIEFNTTAIEKHINEHKQNTNKKSQENAASFTSTTKSDNVDGTTLYTKPVMLSPSQQKQPCSQITKAEEFARQNGLTHNSADNSFYCDVCCRRIATTLNALENHVSSNAHKNKVSKRSTKRNKIKMPEKVLFVTYIKTVEMIEEMTHTDVIVNNKYWLNAYGFNLIGKLQNKVMCQSCDIDLTLDEVMHHLATSALHRQRLAKCFFITSLENEFIREIKHGVYHCGYCTVVVNSWENMLEHIATEEHIQERSNSLQRVRNHKSKGRQS